jgi:hypothetical protein
MPTYSEGSSGGIWIWDLKDLKEFEIPESPNSSSPK